TNDTDADGDTLTVTAVTQGAHGSVALSAGSVAYTPAADFFGTDTFTYTVSDGAGGTSTATVTVTVTAVNDAPVAAGQTVTTAEDTPASGQVRATDVDSPSLTFTVAAGPANGSLVLNTNGTFTYTPNANYNGPDSFTFTASDGTADSNTATVSITVTAVNDAPVALPQSATTTEDVSVSGTVVATDTEGSALTYAVVEPPAHGTVTLNRTTGAFVYAPNADYFGDDCFTFQASDGNLVSNVAAVSIRVAAVNDDPTAVADSLAVNEDSGGTTVAVLANDSFAPDTGETLTVQSVGPAGNGVASLAGGVVRYTPNPNYNGPDSFTYTVSDGNGGTATGTVRVTVTAVNDRPTVAAPSAATTAEDTVLELTALGGVSVADPADGSAGTFTATVSATNGTLTGTGFTGSGTASLSVTGTQATVNAALATVRFRPAANFNGSATLTTTVNDNGNTGAGGPLTASATTTVTVTAVNDAPTLAGAAFTVRERAAVGTVVGTVTGHDIEGASLAYSITAGNAYSAFAIDPATGRITVANPAALVAATTPQFRLTVRATDPGGLSGEATVVVDVVAAARRVTIDVIPDSRQINSRSNGKIEVAIMGAAGFDVRSVDVESLRFGRTGQEDSISRDGRGRPQFEYRDVDRDGRLDLVVRFDTARTGFRPGDTRAFLTGKLLSGDPFDGDDAVSVH
ncbi:MAG TPA: Ig-like domain-containing protein, partial [Urbifossiella sp.]|nr:Ig-like domain-containing protein [Urbifossiella sp.]